MANRFSLIERAPAWPRILGYFILLALSQLVVSSVFREKLLEIIRRKKKTTTKQTEQVPLAKPSKYRLLSLFLGHFADVKPWSREGGGIMMQLIDCRFQWYRTIKNRILDTVRVKILYDDYIFTKDLDIIQSFHGKEDKMFRNSDTIRRAWGTLFPDSITVLTGDKWKRVRRVFVSAMSKLDYEVLPPSTNEVLEQSMFKYVTEDRQEVRMWDIFAKITFDSFHKFMYDINFNTIGGENLDVLSDLMTIASKVSDRMMVSLPILWKLPTRTNSIIWACHKRLVTFVDSYIEERAALLEAGTCNSDKKFTNLLDAMILAAQTDNTKKKLTHREIRTQLCAAMFGGFDTTTSSLSFIFINLAKHPECQERLYQEVKDVDLKTVTKTELDNLKYLNGVIKETMRLNAVAPLVVRIPNEDIVVKGKVIKEGTNVLVDHYSLGQQSEHWKNAEDLQEFKPERWFDFSPVKGTFFPFGFGGRQCPGYKVATSQMQVIVSFMMKNYIIELSEKPIKVITSLGVTVSRDSTLVLRKRK